MIEQVQILALMGPHQEEFNVKPRRQVPNHATGH